MSTAEYIRNHFIAFYFVGRGSLVFGSIVGLWSIQLWFLALLSSVWGELLLRA